MACTMMLCPFVVQVAHAQTQRSWKERAAMPTPRSGASAVVLDDRVYVLGGKNEAGNAISTVEIYDPETNTWTTGPAMSIPRFNAAAVVNGNQIVVAGGRGGENNTVLNSSEVFDPATGSWTALANLQSRREGLSAVILGGNIFLLGGSNENEQFLDSVESYNALQNQWSPFIDWNLQISRASFASVVLADSVYSFGGFSAFGPLGLTQRFHPLTGVAELRDFTPARGGLSAVVLDDAIYVAGGKTGNNETVAAVNRYLPSTNQWEQVSPMLQARENAPAVAINNQLIVFGGTDVTGRVMGSVEAYDDVVAPVATNDIAATNEDTAVDINVILNDTDPAAGTLLVNGFTQPQHGAVTQVQAGILRYQPALNFFGNDLFSYTIENSEGGTAIGVVQIVVAPLDDPPVFISTPIPSALVNVLYTYDIMVAESDGEPVTIEAPVLPAWLQFDDMGDGTAVLSGTPTATDAGQVEVTLSASDGITSVPQTFLITVVDGLPPIPELLSPANEMGVDETTVTFSWTGSEGSQYQFQLATNASFASPRVDSLLSDSTLELGELDQQQYYWRVRATNAAGVSDWSATFTFFRTQSVHTEEERPGVATSLPPAYPNPFRDTASIPFSLELAGQQVSMEIFDLNGRKIKTLVDSYLPAGQHQASWNGRDQQGRLVASGIYVIRLQLKQETRSRLITFFSN